jgi:hypothetical protein
MNTKGRGLRRFLEKCLTHPMAGASELYNQFDFILLWAALESELKYRHPLEKQTFSPINIDFNDFSVTFYHILRRKGASIFFLQE